MLLNNLIRGVRPLFSYVLDDAVDTRGITLRDGVGRGKELRQEEAAKQHDVDYRDQDKEADCIAVEVDESAEPQLQAQPQTSHMEAPR